MSHQLAADTDYVALCHWNANIDNAWFWRDAGDVLHCGLLDWGWVGQMNMGMAIWGAMSGAETEVWNCHFDELLQLFVAEVHRFGGPDLDECGSVPTYPPVAGMPASGTTKASARRCRCCPTC